MNIPGAETIGPDKTSKPISILLEIVPAACGDIGKNGLLKLFGWVAVMLEQFLQLDVENSELFEITTVEDEVD